MIDFICSVINHRFFRLTFMIISVVSPFVLFKLLYTNPDITFRLLWINTYSTLIVCLLYKNNIIRTLIVFLSFCFLFAVSFMMLEAGLKIILAVIFAAFLPFIPNPWL